MPTINNIPELLAPVGNWDSLNAAIANGADAVYLGTKEFNARLNAGNFSLAELGKVVSHCHTAGVRVYLTLNTLVKNNEITRFFRVLAQAYEQGIDGVVIQHISFLDVIKSNFPGLLVFISTQAAIGNYSSAALLKTADRIILPREMSLAEIKALITAGVSVEVFVHGALCFGYSGLCLFSSFVDNRSGNRGACAQLCRQKYNGTYPLSTKELCLVNQFPELIAAGISGFKIEGRMRSALYVAVATRLYRKAIDAYRAGNFTVPHKEMAEIEVVFNREFTEGFLSGDNSIIAPEKPMNRGAFLGTVRGKELVLARPVTLGDGVGIWHNDRVSGTVIRHIIRSGKEGSSAAAGDRVDLSLDAPDGAKIYLTSSREISLAPDFVVRRSPIATPHRQKVATFLPKITPRQSTQLKIMVKTYSRQEAFAAAEAGADAVFYDVFAPDFPLAGYWQAKATLGAYLPRLLSEDELHRALALLRRQQPQAVLTGNLGFLAHRAEFKIPVYLDYAFNVFNDVDLDFFRRYDAIPMVSPELSLSELAGFKNKDVAVFCHGDIAMVNTRIELPEKKLVNEKGAVFPVRKEDGYWQIMNSRPFGLFNDIRKLYALGFRQFFIDHSGKGARFAELYRRMLTEDVPDRRLRKGYTSGHLYRPVL